MGVSGLLSNEAGKDGCSLVLGDVALLLAVTGGPSVSLHVAVIKHHTSRLRSSVRDVSDAAIMVGCIGLTNLAGEDSRCDAVDANLQPVLANLGCEHASKVNG